MSVCVCLGRKFLFPDELRFDELHKVVPNCYLVDWLESSVIDFGNMFFGELGLHNLNTEIKISWHKVPTPHISIFQFLRLC